MSSSEVQEAVGLEGKSLEERAAQLRKVVETPTAREAAAAQLAEIEQQIAMRDAAALKAEASRRLLGIKRAYGALMIESDKDDSRVCAAATAFLGAMITLDERFIRLSELRREAQALCEVFGLDSPELPIAIVPALREVVKRGLKAVNAAPIRDNGFVQEAIDRAGRRTFAELSGTEGFALIQRARGAKARE